MKVSVIIPTYNYAQFIGDALNSILSQDYDQSLIEVIVIDDGSTDNTEEVVSQYTNRLQALSYFKTKNQGKAAATYLGIHHATGELIFNLDADDYFFYDKLKTIVNVFQKNLDIVHVGAAAKIWKEGLTEQVEVLNDEIADKPISGNTLLRIFYTMNYIYGGGSTFVARSCILKKIDIPSGVDMYIDEFLLLAILPYGKSYLFKRPLSVWRVHDRNYSTTLQRKSINIKNQRLLSSSTSVLTYLKSVDNYDPFILKIYTLVHLNRFIYFKELEKRKTLNDISLLLKFLILNRINLKILRHYKIVNRLLPQIVINIIRSVR